MEGMGGYTLMILLCLLVLDIVYKRCVAAKSPAHPFDVGWSAFCQYMAFSKDNSSLIRWTEKNDEITSKEQFIRVAKSEVLPQGINRDFLE